MSTSVRATEPAWLSARRMAAQARFNAQGLPTPNDESWRFTTLRALTPPAALGAARITLNAPALPEGVRFTTLSSLLAQAPGHLAGLLTLPEAADGFAALNMALFQDGFVLEIPPGVHLTEPLEVIYDPTGGAVHTRGLVLLGEGASAILVEHAIGGGWSNHVTHIALAKGARLRHAKRQAQPAGSVHLSATTITLGEGADHESVILALGAAISREAVNAVLAGEQARFSLRGAYVLGASQEASFVPDLLHLAPNCTSRQLVKGVLGGQAHGVFLGHIGVPEGADGTDASQTNRNLLLTEGAHIDTRPRLEILADDVKCSHGATVGDLDDAALFYLQSRGIPPLAARHMLVEAFAAEILDEADLPAPLRAALHGTLSAKVEALS